VAKPPADDRHVYEIKHDGYRLVVRKADGKVRIYSRRGADFTKRFSRIVEAVQGMRARSIILDGEGVICDDNGLAIFDALHSKQRDDEVSLYAFDLLELDACRCASARCSNERSAYKQQS
jgi:bifunctional non-homologous end joining protein LigD